MPSVHLKKPYVSGSHKDKFNPVFRQKKQTLIKDIDDKTPERVVRTEAGDVLFQNGLAVVPDDQRGADIAAELSAKKRHRDQLAIIRHREGVNTDSTHRYFVSVPQLPWKKEE